MASMRGTSGLCTVSSIYTKLDEQVIRQFQEETGAASLLELMKIKEADLMTDLLKYLLKKYNYTDNVFIFGEEKLAITLEDVLYITGLPIVGEPVICQKSRDADAFERVFGIPKSDLEHGSRVKLHILKNIALNDCSSRRGQIALLTILVSCFVTPTTGGHGIPSTYVQFLENLMGVDTYAWGAALLAYLYEGLSKTKKGKTNINGNLSFFLIRIPKLRSALGIKLKLSGRPAPLLPYIVEEVQKISFNHMFNYIGDVKKIMKNLSRDKTLELWEHKKLAVDYIPHRIRTMPSPTQEQEEATPNIARNLYDSFEDCAGEKEQEKADEEEEEQTANDGLPPTPNSTQQDQRQEQDDAMDIQFLQPVQRTTRGVPPENFSPSGPKPKKKRARKSGPKPEGPRKTARKS